MRTHRAAKAQSDLEADRANRSDLTCAVYRSPTPPGFLPTLSSLAKSGFLRYNLAMRGELSASKETAMAEINQRRADLDRIEEFLSTCTPGQITLLRDILVVPISNSLGATVRRRRALSSATNSAPERTASGRGALIAAVQQAIDHYDVITSSAILEHLNKQGFKFVNENPIAPVSAILGKLQRRGKLIQIRKAKGQTPAEYRKPRSSEKVRLAS